MPADDTPNLLLPYILPAQAQKHVTHNEAIRALDALVQLSVVDRNLATPPGSPADGARYIVAASPTGAWAGHAGKVAAWQDGAWAFYAPREGWVAWVEDEDGLVAWNGSAWVAASSGGGGGGIASLNPATGGLVGVNATADATNRLAVASPASLFNHAGAGHQQKINKAAAGDTASQLYQTGFSGRAEIGLVGDDNFRFKVSPDGATWRDAIVIDRTTGAVSMPFTSSSSSPVQSLFYGGIVDNGVAVIPITSYGIILVQSTAFSLPGGFIYIDTVTSPSIGAVLTYGGTINLSLVALTGTTGPDGNLNIACTTDNLYIENRLGATRTYRVLFFPVVP